METKERALRMIATQLSVDEDTVKPDARLMDDLGADSLDVVELIMLAEEEFGIEITDEEAEGLGTVEDLLQLVQAKAR